MIKYLRGERSYKLTFFHQVLKQTCCEVAAPTEEGLHELLQTVIARLMRLPTRRGVLFEDDGQSTLAEPNTEDEEAHTLRPL